MNSPKPPATPATLSHRKHHNHSSSLGSLYEVLADLDETQLQYLVQELNHTGHENLSVSEAVSTFEGQRPFGAANTPPRAHLPPSVQVPQRQLSKSQRGKLRLQTAFERSTHLRQRRFQEDEDANPPRQKTQAPAASGHEHTNDSIPAVVLEPSDSCPSPIKPREIGNELLKPSTTPEKEVDTVENSASNTRTGSRSKSPAYRHIPRPDFQLPTGVTVANLLQLLETEFLSSSPQEQSSPGLSISPSSEAGTHVVPSPRLLLPPSPISFPNAPRSRSLRKVSSRLDMALEAERTVSGAEQIGMGMLEPRQLTPASRDAVSAGGLGTSPSSFDYLLKGETAPPPTTPAVLEGIFDVLENY